MKYVTADYRPKGRNSEHYSNALKGYIEIVNCIPDSIKSYFIEFPSYGKCPRIIVDLENQDIVKYLDDVFSDMIADNRCEKRITIEIDENEICNYAYFTIGPELLEYGKYTFGNTRIPDCGGYFPGSSSQNCRVGEILLSPVKVKKRKTAKLDLAELHYGGKDKVLLVSARLKRIFDSEGVTGLIYEPVEFLDSAKSVNYHKSDGINYITYQEVIDDKSPKIESPYLARIPQVIESEADDITIQKCDCPVHNVVYFDTIDNLKVIPSNKRMEDFFQVQGIAVKDRVYLYPFNKFFVSQKVLKLLLKQKAIRGFYDMGPLLKTKFTPVL
ncbi:MAG: hypothetical protein GX455_10145 [Phycisphaerae bacterium]|nr:hypothetical protein [Phycisphaerae bacterium]